MPNFTCNNILSLNQNCGNKKMFGGGNKKQGLVSSIGRPSVLFSMIRRSTFANLEKKIINIVFKFDGINQEDVTQEQENAIKEDIISSFVNQGYNRNNIQWIGDYFDSLYGILVSFNPKLPLRTKT